MPIAGLLFHFVIATAWTAAYYLAYPRFAWLRKNPIAIGAGYGLFVWVVMNLVVLPLSRVRRPASFDVGQALVGALILVFCVGLPIALRARRDHAAR